MELNKNELREFENKRILIVTKNDFSYHTDNLQVLEDCVKFIDIRGNSTILSFSEIKFIQEKNNGVKKEEENG